MLCAYASFIISSSLFKSCIIPVAWVCRSLRSMPITDTSALLRGNPPQKRTLVRFCLVRHFRHFPWHSDFCFPRSANKPVSQSCHLYAACRNAIDRLLHCLSPELSDTERPSFISLAVTATFYMEGSHPFIYRYAPRGTRTGTSVHFSTSVHSRVDVPVPMILIHKLFWILLF